MDLRDDDPPLRGLLEQDRHGRAFSDTDADVAFALSQLEGAFQRHESGGEIA